MVNRFLVVVVLLQLLSVHKQNLSRKYVQETVGQVLGKYKGSVAQTRRQKLLHDDV